MFDEDRKANTVLVAPYRGGAALPSTPMYCSPVLPLEGAGRGMLCCEFPRRRWIGARGSCG